jgi:hypothetical protein
MTSKNWAPSIESGVRHCRSSRRIVALELVASDRFRGCAMVMALVEFPDQDLPAPPQVVDPAAHR